MSKASQIIDQLIEAPIYTRGKDPIPTDDSDIYPRCTNYSLSAFGIKDTTCLNDAHAVLSAISRKGFEYEAVHMIPSYIDSALSDYKTTYRDPGKGRYSWDAKALLKSPYSKYRDGMTVNRFAKTFPKGKFLLGVRGHSMALVNGSLWDYASRGFNKSRVELAFQIFTKSEYKKFMNKYTIPEV